MKDLILELNILQTRVIGLFKPHAYDITYLVIENDHGNLKAVHIGALGGLSEYYTPASRGVYKEFGEGRTLADMKKNPYALDEFYKSFKVKK